MELINPSLPPTRNRSTISAASALTVKSESLSSLSAPSKKSTIPLALKSRKTQPEPSPPPPLHPSLDSYKFKAVIKVSAKIPRTDQVYPILREKMLAGLSFIHEFGDPSAAFIPKKDSLRTIPIYDKPSFPIKQFTTGMHFFVYPTEWSLYPNKKDTCMVRLSTNMGFSVDPSTFLHIMKINLMALGTTYEVKLEQALNTCSKIFFLGAP
jgi:hypothetical protein